MPTILVLENDPVFATVLSDHFQVAGHQVVTADEGAQAVSLAAGRPIDLVVLEDTLAVGSGLDVVRALRDQPESQGVPILVLCAREVAADRIALLRAGADDAVPKPVDLEELRLRADRLLGTRASAASMLSGDLRTHPLRELLQYVRHVGKSGRLVVRGGRGTGEAQIRAGNLVAARWQRLEDREAVLAMLGIGDGTFRFEIQAGGGDAGGETMPLHELLFYAAWVDDELGARSAHVPPTGSALRVMAEELPAIDEAFEPLPLERVFTRVRDQPGVRLFDLMEDQAEAPMSTRLAVAVLAEQGAIGPRDDTPDTAQALSTGEISTSMVVDLTLVSLLAAARDAGFDIRALPFLIVAEAGAWPQLKEVLQSVPGYLQNETLRTLVDELGSRRAASAAFTTELGKLSLHVQVLDSGGKAALEGVVSVSGGVLVWLHDSANDAVRDIVERLERSRGAARGVLIANTAEAQAAARALTKTTKRWHLSDHAPKSLLGVLRLLHPKGSF